MELYLILNGTQLGPYKIEDVKGWIKAGYVNMDDPAWYNGCEDWITVKEIPQINEVTIGNTVDEHLVPPFEAYDGNEPYIFISYAHKDSAHVFKEISQLNDAGYHIWYDEGIEASSEWPEEIANAVIGCSVFLVFISPRSTASVNCRNEINLALNEDKPFLAVHIEESVLPPGLRLRIGDLQAILQYKVPDARYKKKVSNALDQLLAKKKIRSSPSASVLAKIDSNISRKSKGTITQNNLKKTFKNSLKKRTIISRNKKMNPFLLLGIITMSAVLICLAVFFESEEKSGAPKDVLFEKPKSEIDGQIPITKKNPSPNPKTREIQASSKDVLLEEPKTGNIGKISIRKKKSVPQPQDPKRQLLNSKKADSLFSQELLKVVKEWEVVPITVFPLENVKIYSKVTFQNKESKNSAKKAINLDAGKEVTVFGKDNNLLIIAPNSISKYRGKIDIDKTDFKQSVARLFELRKSQREEYDKRKKGE